MSSDGISIPSRLFIKELNILKVYQITFYNIFYLCSK